MTRAALAGLLLALGLASAGCGSATLDPVARAADKTSGAGSEHVDFHSTTEVAGTAFNMRGEGDFDNDRRVGSMRMTFQGGSIDEVMADGTVYVRSTLFSSVLPEGKAWLKIDLAKAGKAIGVDFDALTQTDPTQALAQLKSVGDVETVGEEDLDGVSTTHYRVRLDVDKLPNSTVLKRLGNDLGPEDVWIDDAGYVRRVEVDYSAQQMHTRMTMEFSDFGKDVEVTVPSADETFDATSLAAKGATENRG